MLLMILQDGWYPVETVEGVPLEKQAKDHGELNDHVMKVTTMDGEILWKRPLN